MVVAFAIAFITRHPKSPPFGIPDAREMRRLKDLMRAGKGTDAIVTLFCRGAVYRYLLDQGIPSHEATAFAVDRRHSFSWKESANG